MIEFTPVELEAIYPMWESSYQCEKDAAHDYPWDKKLFKQRAQAWLRIEKKIRKELKFGKPKQRKK